MKHIDKLFKEKLYNHETAVPEGMWEKIAPIAEEESGRAILWFWFAGILALLLGGFGIYKTIISTDTNTTDPGTLVLQNEIPDKSLDLVDNSLIIEKSTPEEKELSNNESEAAATIKVESEEKKSEITTSIRNKTAPVNNKPSKTESTPIIKKQISEPIYTASSISNADKKSSNTEQTISNSVESIITTVGTPANLVITKSYINKEGSVIKQSNLTDESGKEDPVYDVILNSEAKDLNAGALLRIIEPLENIPLPAFQKKLKKKTLKILF